MNSPKILIVFAAFVGFCTNTIANDSPAATPFPYALLSVRADYTDTHFTYGAYTADKAELALNAYSEKCDLPIRALSKSANKRIFFDSMNITDLLCRNWAILTNVIATDINGARWQMGNIAVYIETQEPSEQESALKLLKAHLGLAKEEASVTMPSDSPNTKLAGSQLVVRTVLLNSKDFKEVPVGTGIDVRLGTMKFSYMNDKHETTDLTFGQF